VISSVNHAFTVWKQARIAEPGGEWVADPANIVQALQEYGQSIEATSAPLQTQERDLNGSQDSLIWITGEAEREVTRASLFGDLVLPVPIEDGMWFVQEGSHDHTGIESHAVDINRRYTAMSDLGKPVFLVDDGIAVMFDAANGRVVFRHWFDDPVSGHSLTYYSEYVHLQNVRTDLFGQVLFKGTPFAEIGRTTAAPETITSLLHFNIIFDGASVDTRAWLRSKNIAIEAADFGSEREIGGIIGNVSFGGLVSNRGATAFLWEPTSPYESFSRVWQRAISIDPKFCAELVAQPMTMISDTDKAREFLRYATKDLELIHLTESAVSIRRLLEGAGNWLLEVRETAGDTVVEEVLAIAIQQSRGNLTQAVDAAEEYLMPRNGQAFPPGLLMSVVQAIALDAAFKAMNPGDMTIVYSPATQSAIDATFLVLGTAASLLGVVHPAAGFVATGVLGLFEWNITHTGRPDVYKLNGQVAVVNARLEQPLKAALGIVKSNPFNPFDAPAFDKGKLLDVYIKNLQSYADWRSSGFISAAREQVMIRELDNLFVGLIAQYGPRHTLIQG